MSELKRLLDLAGAASDSADVDWELEAGQRADEQERRLVRALGLLASVLDEHRRLHGISGAPGPGSVWGPLEILGEIGRGSYGTVYRARDPRLDRHVALKLRPEEPATAEALVAEGRLMARVRHPNVATVHGADVHDGLVGLWMELIEGSTLDDVLRERGTLGAKEAIAAALELCGALAAIHAAGLVHGDVKPQNVVRDRDGRLVLADFGCGGALIDQDARPRARTSGSPLFMAPELLECRPKTPRSDIYSLGALLYHVLTARFPVEAETLADLRSAHAERRTHPLRDVRPDLPARLVAVVTRALAGDPALRFESAGEMERALVDALSEPSGARRQARRRWVIGAAVSASVVLVAAAAVIVGRGLLRQATDDAGARPAVQATAHPADGGSIIGAASVTLYRAGVAADEALSGGERVRPGDRLYLEFRADVPAHVYVVNLDRRGGGYLLFPVAGAQWRNPLQPGVSYRLPGDRGWENDSWEVSSAGGKESIILVASHKPLDRLEAVIASLRPASPQGPADPGVGGDDVVRGVGKLADAARAPDGGAAAVAAALRELASSPLHVEGVMVREFVLDNP